MEYDNKIIYSIAKACNDTIKIYWDSLGEKVDFQTWEDADIWQKESLVRAVRNMLDDNHNNPEDYHKYWKKQKEELGWKYGKVKDIEKKGHPFIVDYKDLPKHERVKDQLLVAIVGAFRR